MSLSLDTPTIIEVTHVLIVITIALRVIMRRPARGIAMAWLLLVALFPFAGAIMYLLIGERRITRRRARRLDKLRLEYRNIASAALQGGITHVDWSRHAPAVRAMDRLGRKLLGSPTVRGSRLQLFHDTHAILLAIARDIDAAQSSVLMVFYIWAPGGAADDVLEAVIRAAQRGLHCRVLIDDLGARQWWNSDQPRRLRAAGVELRAALPAGIFHTVIGRTDLRMHRKVAIIDAKLAWTGSMNLVDPRYFKLEAGVGEWIDAMVRVEGAAVVPLSATLIGDWLLESGASTQELVDSIKEPREPPEGPADIQVIPSGPGLSEDGLLQMLIALINAAQDELILTTPYLVPDDAMILALRGAAARGVKVIIIVPEKVDSLLTRYASRSYYDDLLDIGVEIHLFYGGLLHTKSIFVDGSLSMFGTVNLDMRSLWLNYEIALFIYDPEFAQTLRALLQSYLEQSRRLDATTWAARSFRGRLLENALRMASPLL
ncbi:cardiolipin synthase [Uliginosibacterium sp. H3]|uniref:Cardiolipin synthase n=1 Tax=Uliginosibacterium silvisoli TaxID=3114758 RepID=A0ABU6K5T6_9RHOO|nr:cardiolipin synthase [Uliginosibacterium sp. H3]